MEPALIATGKNPAADAVGIPAKFIKANSILVLGGLTTWRLIYPQ
jgi:hypothetical protein